VFGFRSSNEPRYPIQQQAAFRGGLLSSGATSASEVSVLLAIEVDDGNNEVRQSDQ